MTNPDEVQDIEYKPVETQADKFNACYNFCNLMGWDVAEIIFMDGSKSVYGTDFLD